MTGGVLPGGVLPDGVQEMSEDREYGSSEIIPRVRELLA
jgi:hypothetical protein